MIIKLKPGMRLYIGSIHHTRHTVSTIDYYDNESMFSPLVEYRRINTRIFVCYMVTTNQQPPSHVDDTIMYLSNFTSRRSRIGILGHKTYVGRPT